MKWKIECFSSALFFSFQQIGSRMTKENKIHL